MPKKTDPERSEAAAALGRKGGQNGSGDVKKRPSAHYTVTLAEARRKAVLRRKLGNGK